MYNKDLQSFEGLNSESQAYFLGLLMADGALIKQNSIPYRIILTSIDLDIIKKFQSFMKSNAPIKSHQHSIKHQVCYTFEVCNKKIAKDLIKLGLLNNKTHRTFIPKMAPYLIRHFIRGYFDGDGCLYCSKNRRTITITSCSIKILKQIELYCKKNNLIRNNKNYVNHHDKRGFCQEFRIDHRFEIALFLNHLYDKATIFMDRKYNKYLNIQNEPLARKRAHTTSKYFGVTFHRTHKNKPFSAKVSFNNIRFPLGYFHTEIEAAKAYNKKIIDLNLPKILLNKI